MKKLILKIHLIVGLGIGLILSIIGITGSLYVFQPELSVLLYSKLYKSQDNNLKKIEAAEIIRKAENTYDSKVVIFQFPERELETYTVQLQNKKEWIFFDPYNGNVLGELRNKRGIFDDILMVHRTLTLGAFGNYLVGITALLFVSIIIVSGLYLWWPNIYRKKSYKLNLSSNHKRINYDLHSLGGFYLFLPLLVLALTGSYFTFTKSYDNIVGKFFNIKIQNQKPNDIKTPVISSNNNISAAEAAALMQKYNPGYKMRRIIMPKERNGSIYLSYQKSLEIMPGERERLSIFLNPYTGKIMNKFEPLKKNLSTRIFKNIIPPIHLGEIGGFFTRVLNFFFGLIPIFMLYTGFIIYKNKRKKIFGFYKIKS